jgi:hypothetical protein
MHVKFVGLNIVKLFLDLLLPGNEPPDIESVWDIIEYVWPNNSNNFQVCSPLVEKVRYADMGDSEGSMVNKPKNIPLSGSFNQLLLHIVVDQVSGQFPNVNILNCVFNVVIFWHVQGCCGCGEESQHLLLGYHTIFIEGFPIGLE